MKIDSISQLTSGEKDTIRRSKELVITTANCKAESTEEATVFVNDLDVFVVQSLGSSCEAMGHSYDWKEVGSPSLIEDG